MRIDPFTIISLLQNVIDKSDPSSDSPKFIKNLGGRKAIFGYIITIVGITMVELGDNRNYDFFSSLTYIGIFIAVGGNIVDHYNSISRTKEILNSESLKNFTTPINKNLKSKKVEIDKVEVEINEEKNETLNNIKEN
jgi:hypothetical protein